MKLKTLHLRLLSVMLLVFCSLGVWAEETTATIKFGSADGSVKVGGTSVTGNDDKGRVWTIKTVITDASFSQNNDYSQIGSSKKPATSISAEMTCSDDIKIISFEVKMGGFSGTAGNISLKIGDVEVATGSLNATDDVTVAVNNLSQNAKGKTLSISVTNISKGVKLYYISYKYVNAGETVKTDPNLNFLKDVYTFKIGEPFESPVATSDNNAGTITYSIDDESIASVNSSTGQLTLKAVGKTTVKALLTETSTYKEGNASYVLQVGKEPLASECNIITLTPAEVKGSTTDNTEGDSMSSGGVNITSTLAALGNSSEYRFYGGSVNTFSASTNILKIVVTPKNNTDYPDTFVSDEGVYDNDNHVWYGCSKTVKLTVSGTKQIQVNQIDVYVEKPSEPTLTASTTDIDFGSVFATPEPKKVTVTADNISGNVTYNLSDKTNFSATGDVSTGGDITVGFTATAVGTYTATLTISAPGVNDIVVNIKADLQSSGSGSGTEAAPYDVKRAMYLISTGQNTEDDVYVKGVVSQTVSVSSNKLSYWLYNDDTEKAFEVYNGYNLNGAKFYSPTDLGNGDEVVVCGKLTKYNTTLEMAANNKITSLNKKISVSSEGYCSLYFTELAFVVPANAEASTYYVQDDKLVVSKTYASGSTIPAGEAVVIKANKGDYTFVAKDKDANAAFDSNSLLSGFDTNTTTTGGKTYYKLSLNKNEDAGTIGFYWGASNGAAFTNKSHKAYLALPEESSVKAFLLDEAETTAIEAVEAEEMNDGAMYNLAGQKVGEGYKGIVIVNGKKMVKK